jgi:hypothetical protein
MKSIVIQIHGEKQQNNIKLISLHGFNISSPAELALITTLIELYSNNTFMLNDAVKAQIKAKIGGTDGGLKVLISRLIRSGALIKTGKLLGLHVAYKEVKEIEQIRLKT